MSPTIFGKKLHQIIEMGVKAHCTGFTTVVTYDVDKDKFGISKYSTGETEPIENHLVNIFSLENTFNAGDYCTECYPEDDWDNATEEEIIDSVVDDFYLDIMDDFEGFKEGVRESLSYVMEDILSDEIDNLINIKTSQLKRTSKYNDWHYNGQELYPSQLVDFVCEGIDIENMNEFSQISPKDWLNFEYDELKRKQKEGTTNIRVTRSVRNRLAEIGGKDDSFNDIVIKLLEFYEENQ